jgi:hypothetical protein
MKQEYLAEMERRLPAEHQEWARRAAGEALLAPGARSTHLGPRAATPRVGDCITSI